LRGDLPICTEKRLKTRLTSRGVDLACLELRLIGGNGVVGRGVQRAAACA